MDSEPKLTATRSPDILILGQYGSGKSTIARAVAEALGGTHFDAGAELRDFARTNHSEAPMIANLMAIGQLVPARFTVGLLEARMRAAPSRQFVVDGTPRSMEQVVAFEEMLARQNRCVLPILLHISEETALLRQLNRSCSACGGAPIGSGSCERCGAVLRELRVDHNESTSLSRIATFRLQTSPVVEYYRARGLLTIDAERAIEVVVASTLDCIRRQRCVRNDSRSDCTNQLM